MAKSKPEPIGDILAQLMTRRGYGRIQSGEQYTDAWREAAGEFIAGYTRVGTVRRGALEVLVGNSTLMQELGFQKQTLLDKLNQLLPDEKIDNLRFRVGRIET